MDIWILSRLALAVETCNISFENYELNGATTACYNFWLYDLCDVYLVIYKKYIKIILTEITVNIIFRNLLNRYLHQMMKTRFKLYKMFYSTVWIQVYVYYLHSCHLLPKNFIRDCHILIILNILVYLLLHFLKL